LQSIATNHAFNDGNKRTSILLTDLLVVRSRYLLDALDASEDLEQAIEDFVVDTVVQGRCSIDEIAAWLEARIRRA
jgi:prophage maintenance system killer protein